MDKEFKVAKVELDIPFHRKGKMNVYVDSAIKVKRGDKVVIKGLSQEMTIDEVVPYINHDGVVLCLDNTYPLVVVGAILQIVENTPAATLAAFEEGFARAVPTTLMAASMEELRNRLLFAAKKNVEKMAKLIRKVWKMTLNPILQRTDNMGAMVILSPHAYAAFMDIHLQNVAAPAIKMGKITHMRLPHSSGELYDVCVEIAYLQSPDGDIRKDIYILGLFTNENDRKQMGKDVASLKRVVKKSKEHSVFKVIVVKPK